MESSFSSSGVNPSLLTLIGRADGAEVETLYRLFEERPTVAVVVIIRPTRGLKTAPRMHIVHVVPILKSHAPPLRSPFPPQPFLLVQSLPEKSAVDPGNARKVTRHISSFFN